MQKFNFPFSFHEVKQTFALKFTLTEDLRGIAVLPKIGFHIGGSD